VVSEGTETVAVYVLLFLLPQHAVMIVWAFTAAVALSEVSDSRAEHPYEPVGGYEQVPVTRASQDRPGRHAWTSIMLMSA
jgi:hypothetical protein